MAEQMAERGALWIVTESTAQMFGPPREETWAVAVLDDGTEIRMRHLGDRVEVRGWDPSAGCKPPSLRADALGRYHHIVDISAADPTHTDPPTTRATDQEAGV